MENRPPIADAEPPTETASPDAYRIESLAPGMWRASYLEHRAIGASEAQAAERLESLIRGEACASEAWSRRIWTGHAFSADPVILEDRRAGLAAELAEIRPLSPVEWPAVLAAWRRASTVAIGRYRIPDLIPAAHHLEVMRSATRRGSAGPLLTAAEIALVRAVWIPAALAWGLTAGAAILGLAVLVRGVGGLL